MSCAKILFDKRASLICFVISFSLLVLLAVLLSIDTYHTAAACLPKSARISPNWRLGPPIDHPNTIVPFDASDIIDMSLQRRQPDLHKAADELFER
jgi:hypothetical protein